MAGLIRALFGGRSRPPDPNPLPGIGGYRMPRGQTGGGGYPGSTSLTRTFGGNDPRTVGLRADNNSGWESGLSDREQVRQASYRGDVRGAATAGPRSTPAVTTRQPRASATLQDGPGTFYGGPALSTMAGNQTAGGNPLSGAAAAGGHSVRSTQTPATRRQPIIGLNTPGAQNVRNQVAQGYKAVPGQMHTYKSSPRADMAPVNRGGQATDGNVKPERVVTDVTVPSRFVHPGVETWSSLREMPYGGRGDGARGAQLSGQRYYATGQNDEFLDARQGQFGIERERGRKRPVSFTQPAPWASQFYDTTESVGTATDPGTPTQAPNMIYMSPSAGRAGNGTGRAG